MRSDEATVSLSGGDAATCRSALAEREPKRVRAGGDAVAAAALLRFRTLSSRAPRLAKSTPLRHKRGHRVAVQLSVAASAGEVLRTLCCTSVCAGSARMAAGDCVGPISGTGEVMDRFKRLRFSSCAARGAYR